MPKITFLFDFTPKGQAPDLPNYKAGETYDVERSYADKYKGLGLAVDEVVKPAPVAAVEHTESEDTTDAPRTHRRPSRR